MTLFYAVLIDDADPTGFLPAISWNFNNDTNLIWLGNFLLSVETTNPLLVGNYTIRLSMSTYWLEDDCNFDHKTTFNLEIKMPCTIPAEVLDAAVIIQDIFYEPNVAIILDFLLPIGNEYAYCTVSYVYFAIAPVTPVLSVAVTQDLLLNKLSLLIAVPNGPILSESFDITLQVTLADTIDSLRSLVVFHDVTINFKNPCGDYVGDWSPFLDEPFVYQIGASSLVF